jgi:hypothetical protein
MRFRLFGRTRAARRQIWRELDGAARSEPLYSAIEMEAECFAAAMADLCYADGLRAGISTCSAWSSFRVRSSPAGRVRPCAAASGRSRRS